MVNATFDYRVETRTPTFRGESREDFQRLRKLFKSKAAKRFDFIAKNSDDWGLCDSLSAVRMLPLNIQKIFEDPNRIIAVKASTKVSTPDGFNFKGNLIAFALLDVDANGIIHPKINDIRLFLLDDNGKFVDVLSSPARVKIARVKDGKIKSKFTYKNPFLVKIFELLKDPHNAPYVGLSKAFISLQEDRSRVPKKLASSFDKMEVQGGTPYIRLSKRAASLVEKFSTRDEIQNEYSKLNEHFEFMQGDSEAVISLILPHDENINPNYISSNFVHDTDPDSEKNIPDIYPIEVMPTLVAPLRERDFKFAQPTLRVYGNLKFKGQPMTVRVQIPISSKAHDKSEAEIRISLPKAEYPLIRVRGGEAWDAINRLGLLEKFNLAELANIGE